MRSHEPSPSTSAEKLSTSQPTSFGRLTIGGSSYKEFISINCIYNTTSAAPQLQQFLMMNLIWATLDSGEHQAENFSNNVDDVLYNEPHSEQKCVDYWNQIFKLLKLNAGIDAKEGESKKIPVDEYLMEEED